MPALRTDLLTKHYGPIHAVQDLTLSVDREVFGLLGPNGSGKTTTVLMLTTLLTPTSGDAWISDFHIVHHSADVRKEISYVPQDMAVDVKLTGRENIDMFAKLYHVPRRKDRIDELLAIMDLSQRADDLVRTYSGGMRRRLELAQALVHEPTVLFLDEPTIGLDVAARRSIWEHITRLKHDGMTIFVTTHYMDEADQSCDRVAIFNKGRIVACDKPVTLKSQVRKEVITIIAEKNYLGPFPPGIDLISANEGEIILSSDDGKDAIPVLTKLFARNGIEIRSIGVRIPTLDDVFLDFVGNEEEKSGFDDHKFRSMLRRR